MKNSCNKVPLLMPFFLDNNQARSQTFEKGGGANFQEFMNAIYSEGGIVTKNAHRRKILNKCLPFLQF